MTPAIALSLGAQVCLNVIRLDRFQSNPAIYYVVEKMAAITGVLLHGPPAEIALPHVFAQCDQPTVNLLSGNVCLRGEATKEMTSGEKRLKIMRRKSERKAHGHRRSSSAAHNYLLRIIQVIVSSR